MPTSAELLSGLCNKTNKQEIFRDAVDDLRLPPELKTMLLAPTPA